MRTISSFADVTDHPTATLTLPFERRVKMRQRVTLDGGEEVMLDLPRGRVLQDQEKLKAADGLVILVRAADESLSVARGAGPRALARASYHLGNRHVAVQVEEDAVLYLADHVLDAMVRQLGLSVEAVMAPFCPETGAYGHDHG